MLEIVGDLFDQEADATCITTNGCVKANGDAVMGCGCAKEAAERWPGIAGLLGSRIQDHGVRVECLTDVLDGKPAVLGNITPYHIIAFPVKPARWINTGSNVVAHMRSRFARGQSVPGWALKALPSLIDTSALQLAGLAQARGWRRVVLPPAGCGAGELGWPRVRSILRRHLDERFLIVRRGRETKICDETARQEAA